MFSGLGPLLIALAPFVRFMQAMILKFGASLRVAVMVNRLSELLMTTL